jgi:chitinase
LSVPSGTAMGTTYDVQVIVSDGQGASYTWPFNRVTVTSNNTPVIASSTQSTTTVSSLPGSVNYSVSATDADGDALTYQWKVNGTVVTGATASYTLSIPTGTASGTTYAVTVTVSDGKGGSVVKSFDTVTVYVSSPTDGTVINVQ